jgi:hypothetical protein
MIEQVIMEQILQHWVLQRSVGVVVAMIEFLDRDQNRVVLGGVEVLDNHRVSGKVRPEQQDPRDRGMMVVMELHHLRLYLEVGAVQARLERMVTMDLVLRGVETVYNGLVGRGLITEEGVVVVIML